MQTQSVISKTIVKAICFIMQVLMFRITGTSFHKINIMMVWKRENTRKSELPEVRWRSVLFDYAQVLLLFKETREWRFELYDSIFRYKRARKQSIFTFTWTTASYQIGRTLCLIDILNKKDHDIDTQCIYSRPFMDVHTLFDPSVNELM